MTVRGSLDVQRGGGMTSPQLFRGRGRRVVPELPDVSHQLLLRAALVEQAEACRAWEQWRAAGGNIDSVDAQTFHLLPLVYRSLEASGVADPDLARLKGVYRHAWTANQQRAHRTALALDCLRREGIPTMVLGGAAVSVSHYRDLGVRRLDDSAVLVPPDDAERALSVLRACGWSMRARIEPRRVLRSAHATTLVQPSGDQLLLHWRVLPESIDDKDFWSAAVNAEVAGVATLVPGPAQQLLHACAHDEFFPVSLRWVADAGVIIRSAGATIDWARLVVGANGREVALRVSTALSVLVGLLGTPIPHAVISELQALPSGGYERFILRLAQKPVRFGSYVWLWKTYRRRVTFGRRPIGGGFLQYVADMRELPSRRAIGPMLARRAVALVAGPRQRLSA